MQYANLIRKNSTFAESSEYVKYFSTELGLIKNLCSQLRFTRAHICRKGYYILHTKYNPLLYPIARMQVDKG